MNVVRYRDGYRFQLAEPFQIQTPIRASCAGNHFVGLQDGMLTIAAGFAWDGASGPIDQAHYVIRASLCHDAFYLLFRECGLSLGWRDEVDTLLGVMMEEDGAHPLLASAAYQAVRKFGAQHADPRAVRPVLVAPLPVEDRMAPEWQAP